MEGELWPCNTLVMVILKLLWFFFEMMVKLTCDCDDRFWFLGMSGLVDEDVSEMVIGKISRSHPAGSHQGDNQNPGKIERLNSSIRPDSKNCFKKLKNFNKVSLYFFWHAADNLWTNKLTAIVSTHIATTNNKQGTRTKLLKNVLDKEFALIIFHTML